ncbi:MAG: hypothetical protein KGQ75_18210 [Sphingomonadales bacterium]|nr:hypothetical protein [Sphingomonadales bacterium]
MAELSAASLPKLDLHGARAYRPLLYRIASSARSDPSAASPFAGAGNIATGSVAEVSGSDVFSVAPGEWFVRLASPSALPEWHEAMLVSSCCDNHVEWRISSDWLGAICSAYGSHAQRPLAPGRAMALGIAGERMMVVRPASGEAWLYHEAALLDWFAGLIRTIQM